jgi:hypothetical protein
MTMTYDSPAMTLLADIPETARLRFKGGVPKFTDVS